MTVSTLPSPPSVEDPDNLSTKMENWMTGFNAVLSSTNSTAGSVWFNVTKYSGIYNRLYEGGVLEKQNNFIVFGAFPKVYLQVPTDSNTVEGGGVFTFTGTSTPSWLKKDSTAKVIISYSNNNITGRSVFAKVLSEEGQNLSLQVLNSWGSPDHWFTFGTQFYIEPSSPPTGFRFLNKDPSDSRTLDEILGSKKKDPLKNYYGVTTLSNGVLHCVNVNRKWTYFTGTMETF